MKTLENFLWIISVSLIAYGIFGAMMDYTPYSDLKTIIATGFLAAIIASILKINNSINDRNAKA